MEIKKKVKVLRQGATTVTIPKQICDLCKIKPGDTIEFVLDAITGKLTINYENK